jgi:multidrug resistance efflux pump
VQPSGSIQILFAMAHELPLRERSGKEIAYPFEVLTANRNFVFVVDSEEVRSEWVNAIKDLNAKLMKTQLQHTLKGRQRSIASMLAKVTPAPACLKFTTIRALDH